MRVLIPLVIISIGVATIGCAATNKSNTAISGYDSLLVDEAFPGFESFDIESEQEIFALDDAMQIFLKKNIRTVEDPQRRIKQLVKHLFSRDYIDLAYQTNANLTASQAFHSQTANCLSLTIMAYSLAREADLEVSFKHVDVPEYWIRNGQYNTLAGHVNLEVKAKKPADVPILMIFRATIVDFDPSIYAQKFDSSYIDKSLIMAMFYNNKGAEALVAGSYALAYAYFKASIKAQPNFTSAWSNLGVLYRHNEMLHEAKKAYELALVIDEDNYTAYRSLAITLTLLGQNEKAQAILANIHKKRLKNPYYLVMLGNESFYKGEYQKALRFYQRAKKLEPEIHEIYFGLAKTYYAMHDLERAEKYLQKAIRYSSLDFVDNQYTAKLNLIRSEN